VAIKPILQALLLADNIYTHVETGKRVIAGVFDSITLQEVPGHSLQASSLYIALKGIRGRLDVMVRYVDLESNEVLREHGPIRLEWDDPLTIVDFVVPVSSLPVPHEGVYLLEVLANDELIGMLRIIATLADESDEEEEENA
jgi:hypothetical protein